jgi:outer membrane protein TolC
VLARFTYTFTPSTQFNVFGGYSFGASTESTIKYNSFIFGIGLSFNLPLF